MEEIIELIIADFDCNDEYIYDAFYKYLTQTFPVKFPKETEELFKFYFPDRSSVNLDDLYEKIKTQVVESIIEINNDMDKYF